MDPLTRSERDQDTDDPRVVGHQPPPDPGDEQASERFWAPRTDFPDREAFDHASEHARRAGRKARRG